VHARVSSPVQLAPCFEKQPRLTVTSGAVSAQLVESASPAAQFGYAHVSTTFTDHTPLAVHARDLLPVWPAKHDSVDVTPGPVWGHSSSGAQSTNVGAGVGAAVGAGDGARVGAGVGARVGAGVSVTHALVSAVCH
jgi:hypothetical protein